MAITPVFCCGFECGVARDSSTAHVGQHWDTFGGGSSFTTSSPLSGARSLSGGYANTNATFGAGIWVFHFKAKFSSLPSGNRQIGSIGGNGGVAFRASDSSIVTCDGVATLGTTGVAVTTGVTYSIDVSIDTTANPHIINANVDGTACSQLSNAVAAVTTAQALYIGFHNGTGIGAGLYDDVLLSLTSADYPLGAGHVDAFIPTSDGTHNVAGASDFERTLTGVDITNATTDAYQLIDDAPLESGASVDWQNMVAPPNQTDYVECVFGPAPGVSTPTVAPLAVEIIAGYHQAGTGLGTMGIEIWRGVVSFGLYYGIAKAGVTSVNYATAQYGGSSTLSQFNDLRVRFGSVNAIDANPDQYFDCVMIEAWFAEAAPAGKRFFLIPS